MALKQLGFFHSSWYKPIFKEYKKGNIDKVLWYTSKFDSFDDLPWFDRDFIPVLDQKFPNSKFINLTREEAEWKKSYKRYFNKTDKEVEIAYLDFMEHQKFIGNYFLNKKGKLITISVRNKNAFNIIANFVNKKIDYNEILPHKNKS